MKLTKYLIAACALLTQHALAAIEVVSPEVWTLYRGTSIVQPRVAYPSKDACQAAAPVDVRHRCQGTETFVRRADAPPPPPPPTPTCTTPQPAPETRTQSCPSGTTGSWKQTQSFTAAPHPTCWAATGWLPVDAPAGSCVPVVEPPPPPPPPVSTGPSKPQGATQVDVVTAPIAGKRTFHIRSNAEALAHPWGTAQCGDAINFYAPAVYSVKIGLRAQCTAAEPLILNGVTDADGNRPIFDFKDSRTASGSANVFSATLAYGESLGGIVIKRGPNDAYFGPKPSHIQILNLEVRGAANGNSYTSISGARGSLNNAAAIYIHVGADILIDNVIAKDNAFGVFTMAKDGELSQASERITVRNSRFTGNGVVGEPFQHGAYIQAIDPVIEGNFFGPLRKDAQGSAFKDRSARLIFRGNYAVATARAVDIVQSEDQTNGIAKLPTYGTDYMTGNTIISDGPECVHFGGDNMGEQDGSASVFNPGVPYRRTLYFWNNTCTITSAGWRTRVFDLSLRDTTVHAWGNTFNLNWSGGGTLSWLEFAGQLRLGTNVVNGLQPVSARDDANAAMFSVTTGNPVPALPAGL